MDRITSVQLFVRVVETGSFSKTALEFGVAQPTVTKAIAATEKRLGARLLHRSTRGLTTTEIGALYYDKCKLIEQQLDEADNLAMLLQSKVAGTLRISTSVGFGRRMMVPVVLQYMREHPDVTVDLSFDDRYVNLVEQGVDLAVRMGRLADSSLGASFLGMNPWVMVASPDYLSAHGTPNRPEALADHTCLVYSSVQGDERWSLTGVNGQTVMTPVRGRLRSNNLTAVLQACCAGMGIAILPRYVVHQALADKRVVTLMPGYQLPGQEIHAVYPSPKMVPSKVTHFIQFVRDSLQGDWWERSQSG